MQIPSPQSFILYDWHNFGRWIQAPLSGAFWAHWHESEPLKRVLTHPFNPFLFIHGHTVGYKPDQTYTRTWLEDLLKNDSADKVRRLFEDEAKKAKERHLQLFSSNLNDEDHVKELFETYRDLVGLWSFAIFIDEALNEHLQKLFGETPETLLKKIQTLPKRKTWLEQETIDLKTIAEQVQSGASQEELLQKHVANYQWFGTHHWEGPAYTIEAARSSIEGILTNQKPPSSENTDQELLNNPAWRWFETSLYWRTHSAELTASVVFASRSRLTNIAERFGIMYDDLIQCSAVEIIQALHDPKTLPNQETRNLRRTNGYGCIVDDRHIEHMFQGTELEEWMKAIEEPIDSSIDQDMKGLVACVGPTIEGEARVILSPRGSNIVFEDGDILIAFETTPDYVPLMKRAGAIVTEHGGITSHAAIVARELGKPCIIGVKNVTRLIKDGMTIRVSTQENLIQLL